MRANKQQIQREKGGRKEEDGDEENVMDGRRQRLREKEKKLIDL